MSEPFDEISAAAERAREHLREDFEQLRAEIEGEVEESPGGSSPAGGGNPNKAWASFAAFALAAAVAAAAANFALNGGRTSKDSSVSVPPSSSQPEPGAITAGAGSPRVSSPLLAAFPPALQFDAFGSNGALPGAPSPFPSAESVFVVGALTPVGARGVPSENVAGADPVDRPTAAGGSPGPPLAQPDAPQELAYTPPPPPDGGHGGGEGPGEGPGDGEGPGEGEGPGGGGEKPPHGGGEKPPHGGGSDDGDDGGSHGDDGGSHGNGQGKGHIKGRGKGHDGDSPGKGHEKYDGGQATAMPDTGGNSGESDGGDGGPEDSGSGRTKEHGKGHEKNQGSAEIPTGDEDQGDGSPGHGHEKGRGPAAPPPPPPAAPAPPAAGPEPGSGGDSGSSENPGRGHGKSGAPGQAGK